MAYKIKPRKSAAKRFKVTKTGKLKRHHSFTSHLMSARPANKRRKLRKSAVLSERHARNMRVLMNVSGLRPARTAHRRALAAAAAEKLAATGAATTETAVAKKPAVKAKKPAIKKTAVKTKGA
jgi:large subunit ribosomal protein L35